MNADNPDHASGRQVGGTLSPAAGLKALPIREWFIFIVLACPPSCLPAGRQVGRVATTCRHERFICKSSQHDL
jgi:hypothetical protein